MSKQWILIVEDEVAIRAMLRCTLEISGFVVQEAENIVEAQNKINQQRPNLILLDWMLPSQNGVDYIQKLKKDVPTHDIPVIMLTAKAEEENRIRGLDVGADDYIIKPFSPRELVARIKAVLRRSQKIDEQGALVARELIVDTNSQRVTIQGESIKLGPLEYRLLCFFITHPDRVYTRDALLNRVWENRSYVDERTVDVHIRRLRKQLSLGKHDRLIQTVHGSGYRFSEQENEQ